MQRKLFKSLTCACALFVVPSCSNSNDATTAPTQAVETISDPTIELPVVVVTYSVLGDLVAQLVGDKAVVKVIIPDGQDPHEFQPSAKDIETLNNAAMVVSNGLEFEEGLKDVINNVAESGNKVFMVGEHITVLKIDSESGHESIDESGHESSDESGHESTDDHQHGGADPHLWLSPATMLEMLPALTSELSDTLGVDLAESSANLTASLQKLDSEIKQIISGSNKCNLVSGHDELGYFAAQYGCLVIGAIIPSFTTTSEATAGELADLKKLVQKYQVPAIFTGLGTNPEVADQLAKELGIKATTLSTHYLNDLTSYQEFMLKLANQIAEALGN